MTTEVAPKPHPWLCLWRAESGSFAQLPLFARALFAEMLKLADDHGEIAIGEKSPDEAVAFALGATRSDRGLLKKYMPVLIADGCVEVVDGVISFPGWARFQPPTKAPKKPRKNSSGATVAQPSSNGSATVAQRQRSVDIAKCAESYDGTECALNRIEKEKEEEEEEELRAKAPPRKREKEPPDPATPIGRWRLFEDAWRDAFGGGGLGLYDAKRGDQSMRIEVDWLPEVAAMIATLQAGDGWAPSDPWAFFVKHAGNWPARLRAAKSKATTTTTGPRPKSNVARMESYRRLGLGHIVDEMGAESA